MIKFNKLIKTVFCLCYVIFYSSDVLANIDVPSSDIIQFSGRLHLDLLYNNNKDKNNKINVLKTAKNDLSGFNISSAMFNTKFRIIDNSLVVLKMDVKPNSISVRELYFMYNLSNKIYFIFGQIGVQSSLESIGYNYTVFNNYSLFSSCDLFASYTNGLTFKYIDNKYGAYVGIYSNSIHDKPSEISKLTLVGRTYFNPIRSDNDLIHLGLNAYHENRKNKNTDKMDDLFKQIQRIGAEFAINYSIFNFQSEYRTAWINFEKYQKSFSNLYNFYVECNINLTGESMIYKEGAFDFLKVKKSLNKDGYGAFSLSFKFSKTNMNLKNNVDSVNYGNYNEYMTALNWTPKDGFRFTLQYSRIAEDFVNSKNTYDLVQLKTRIFF